MTTTLEITCRQAEGIAPPEPRIEGDDILLDVGYGRVAVMDIADYEIAVSKHWRIYRGGRYAYAYEGKQKIYLHRVITGAPDGMAVDHFDGDTLNDRRANLRVLTQAQNNQNVTKVRAATGVRGVRVAYGGKFDARVKVGGMTHHLGTFDTLEMAKAVVEEGRRQLMTHSAENASEPSGISGGDLDRYLSEACMLCERRSRWGMHLSCVVLTHLSAPQSADGWVSREDLRDGIGRTESLESDLERIRGSIRSLRQQGWMVGVGPLGYRLEGRSAEDGDGR